MAQLFQCDVDGENCVGLIDPEAGDGRSVITTVLSDVTDDGQLEPDDRISLDVCSECRPEDLDGTESAVLGDLATSAPPADD